MVYLQSQLSMSHLACSPLAYNDTKSSSVFAICFCICHLLLHRHLPSPSVLAICSLCLLTCTSALAQRYEMPWCDHGTAHQGVMMYVPGVEPGQPSIVLA